MSRNELLRKFPKDDLVEDWFFRVEEISNGAFLVEGIDHWGRSFSKSGGDPEEMLREGVAFARSLNATRPKQPSPQ